MHLPGPAEVFGPEGHSDAMIVTQLDYIRNTIRAGEIVAKRRLFIVLLEPTLWTASKTGRCARILDLLKYSISNHHHRTG